MLYLRCKIGKGEMAMKKLIMLVVIAASLICFALPVNPALATSPGSITFNEVSADYSSQVLFPGGRQIIATFDLGMPLGEEKALLEPQRI